MCINTLSPLPSLAFIPLSPGTSRYQRASACQLRFVMKVLVPNGRPVRTCIAISSVIPASFALPG